VARSDLRVALITAFLVVFAASVGLFLGSRARPAAAPQPTPAPRPESTTVALPSATPVDPAEAQRRAFAQPLSAGCATDRAVWIFADGGAAIRFDGRLWTIPDPTLRSLSGAACRGGEAVAVGDRGTILTADDDRRELRADRTGIEDLRAIAVYPSGALAVGTSGTLLQQTAVDWSHVDAGITDDLYGVAVAAERLVTPGRAQVWVVGARGLIYRFTERGWERVDSGTTATLRGVIMLGDGAVAAGDGGTLLRFAQGRWIAVATGTDAALRAVAIVGATTAWAVGDRGMVVELLGEQLRRVDLGTTTCTLRAVFPQGSAVWVVGSDGIRGGAWRVTPSGMERWGSC
jgi:hypothetical protein